MIRDSGRRGGPSPMNSRRGVVPANVRSVGPPCQQKWKPQCQSDYRRDQPPGPPPRPNRPNFVIQLLSDNRSFKRKDVEGLIGKLNCKPDKFNVFERGFIAASLFFQQWTDALETMVFLWEIRLDGTHLLTPRLICNVIVPSDTDELNYRLKVLFVERLKGFMEGDMIKNWQKKLGVVLNEIQKIDGSLKKRNNLAVYYELSQRKQGLVSEKGLIVNRIKEFECGMKCLLDYVEGKKSGEGCGEEVVKVFDLKGGFDWCRIHCLMMRECRRLEDGLPIYAFRQEILRQIHCQQVFALSMFFFFTVFIS